MLVEESGRLRVEQNLSIRRAGEVLGVPFQLLSKWGREVAQLCAASQAKRRARNMKAVINGPASQLELIFDELLQFIFSKREQGAVEGRGGDSMDDSYNNRDVDDVDDNIERRR